MGLLDGGLSGVFAAALAPFYLDGTLHVPQVVSDGEGGYTRTFTPYPIKGQVDSYSDEYRARAGIPDTDARLIILQHGAGATPTTDSEITIRGVRYQLQPPIQQDPAQAAWTIRGRPVVATPNGSNGNGQG